MKRKQTILFLLFLAGLLRAEKVDKSLCTFSTPGIDRYADGSAAADGETYYLIFVPQNALSHWGIDNRGGVIGGASLKWTAKAQDGRCPPFTAQFAPTRLGAGYFYLVLLDTRGPDGIPHLTNGVFSFSLPGCVVGTEEITVAKTAEIPASGVTSSQSVTLAAGETLEPPRITRLVVAADGNEKAAELTAEALDIGDYSVYQSTDLKTWVPVEVATHLRAFSMRKGVPVPVDATVPSLFFKIQSNVRKEDQ